MSPMNENENMASLERDIRDVFMDSENEHENDSNVERKILGLTSCHSTVNEKLYHISDDLDDLDIDTNTLNNNVKSWYNENNEMYPNNKNTTPYRVSQKKL